MHRGLFAIHHLGEQFACGRAEGKARVAVAEGEPQPRLVGGRAWACASSAKYADIMREADAIFIEELHNAGWYHKTSQAIVVFLPVKSVGVFGDGRRYEWDIALRAVETIDFMTGRWAHLPYELVEKVSNRIVNEIRGVSRVTSTSAASCPRRSSGSEVH